MILSHKIVSVIPARGGSKGILNKNIIELNGQPLIGYSIVDSLRCKLIEETYVSTDSEEIKEIAEKYGAEVPFLRPEKYAQDSSTYIQWVNHFLYWYKSTHDGNSPEYIVHLRPTTPLREPIIIDEAINKILNHKEATSLRSVHKLSESPYKMFALREEYLEGLFPNFPLKEYYNLPRQSFPKVYKPNGYVDILKIEVISHHQSLHGDRILAFETPFVIEIDTLEELEYLQWKMRNAK